MASPYTIIFNALMFYLAFGMFGGWAAVVVIFMPYVAIPVSLILGAIAYGVLEALGSALNARSSLTLLNLLAACSVVCLLLGFLPSRVTGGSAYASPFDILFEDYVVSLVFYSVLLQIMSVAWWLSRRERRGSAA